MNDKVKAKIIEAVPDIKDNHVFMPDVGWVGKDRPITLADVLRAISDKTLYVADGGEFFEFAAMYQSGEHVVRSLNCTWNLTADYDSQSDETKSFIGTLLGVTSERTNP